MLSVRDVILEFMKVMQSGAATVAHLTTGDVVPGPALRAAGDQLSQLVYDGVRYLIVDLSEADFVGGSAALGMLLMLRKLMLAGDGILILRNLSPQTLELFELTRLSEVFEIRQDRPALG